MNNKYKVVRLTNFGTVPAGTTISESLDTLDDTWTFVSGSAFALGNVGFGLFKQED